MKTIVNFITIYLIKASNNHLHNTYQSSINNKFINSNNTNKISHR